MKRTARLLAMLVVGVGSTAGGSGCATPAHSPEERNAMIARNWDYDLRQMTDDFDSVLMLRPASRLTIWNVR